MKFSIITCTWNSEPWLAESIASVRAQIYPDVEHIFVDGGSTDGTLERIEALAGNVKILRNVRGGISNAMNEGVRAATGEVIAHMHSDDYYLGTDVFQKAAAAFAGNDAPFFFGRCKQVVNGVLKDNDFVTRAYSWKALIRGNFVPHAATFTRREAFNRVGGFDTRYKCAMDYDMWLKLAALGAPAQTWDYLAAFRWHSGSHSTVNRMRCHREDSKVRLKHAGYNPLEIAEHLARFAVRTVRLRREHAANTATSA